MSGGLSSKLAWEEDYLSLVGTQTWKYNLKTLFKGIWSPRGLRRGFNKFWLMTGAHGHVITPY